MHKRNTFVKEILLNHKKHRQRKIYSDIANNIGISEDFNLLPKFYYLKYTYNEIKILEKKEIERLRCKIQQL